jgi:hypothetical protein
MCSVMMQFFACSKGLSSGRLAGKQIHTGACQVAIVKRVGEVLFDNEAPARGICEY